MLLAQLAMINPQASNSLYDSSMTFDDDASEAGNDQQASGVSSFALLGKPDNSDKNAKLEKLSDCVFAPIQSQKSDDLMTHYEAG